MQLTSPITPAEEFWLDDHGLVDFYKHYKTELNQWVDDLMANWSGLTPDDIVGELETYLMGHTPLLRKLKSNPWMASADWQDAYHSLARYVVTHK